MRRSQSSGPYRSSTEESWDDPPSPAARRDTQASHTSPGQDTAPPPKNLDEKWAKTAMNPPKQPRRFRPGDSTSSRPGSEERPRAHEQPRQEKSGGGGFGVKFGSEAFSQLGYVPPVGSGELDAERNRISVPSGAGGDALSKKTVPTLDEKWARKPKAEQEEEEDLYREPPIQQPYVGDILLGHGRGTPNHQGPLDLDRKWGTEAVGPANHQGAMTSAPTNVQSVDSGRPAPSEKGGGRSFPGEGGIGDGGLGMKEKPELGMGRMGTATLPRTEKEQERRGLSARKQESWDEPMEESTSTEPVTPERVSVVSGEGVTVSPGQDEYDRQKEKGFGWDSHHTPRGHSHTTSFHTSNQDEQMSMADASLLNKIVHQKLLEVQDADVKINVEHLQQDRQSPLFSVRNFDELHLKEELVKAVADMGFNQPSKIQESALPVLLASPPQNMIAQSQSGTGKTAAFVLTMLMRVNEEEHHPQCICLLPTYELALQIGSVVSKMAAYMPGCKVRYAIRGERVQRGEEIREQIVIGTPGTMLDWTLKFRVFDPRKIKVFVLDEADVMISQQGHQDQSIRMEQTMPAECQRLLFSATYDEPVMAFAERIITKPIIITLRRSEQTLENIRQYYVECVNREDKYTALANLYEALTIGQCIIFCATKKTAKWLSERLSGDGHRVGMLSGDLDITQRADVIQRFKRGNEKILITTNVSARGIDVSQVSIVINYDMPLTPEKRADHETYLHRIGRTGRFGKAGLAINLIDSSWSKMLMQDIQDHFGKNIEKLDTEDQDQLEKIEEER